MDLPGQQFSTPFRTNRSFFGSGIDNRDKSFPIKAELLEFDSKVDSKGLGKWLNNQTSDALFGDAPNPVKTFRIKSESCRIKSRTFLKDSKDRTGIHATYNVEFQILNMGKIGAYRLKPFSDKAKVHLKKQLKNDRQIAESLEIHVTR